MNPHAAYSYLPYSIVRSTWQHRRLIQQMVVRDVVGRYKGSLIGIGWSLFNPMLMLAVYTFVFSVVFNARWNVGDGGNHTNFAIVLFLGLIVHGLFAEVVNSAPRLISSNVNYVKKVIFPLEILPVVTLGAALFQSFVSIGVMLCAFVALNGFLHLTTILLPIIIFPFLLVTLGVAWFLASLGVYLRDIGQFIGLVTTIMLFLSPVFYPISALPEEFHLVIMLNPLTFIIEQSREVVLMGNLPDFLGLAIYLLVSVFISWFGYFWFQKTRRGFSDVL